MIKRHLSTVTSGGSIIDVKYWKLSHSRRKPSDVFYFEAVSKTGGGELEEITLCVGNTKELKQLFRGVLFQLNTARDGDIFHRQISPTSFNRTTASSIISTLSAQSMALLK